ncbi:MAG: hypothetical protein ACI8WB_006079 [Phenylobacterium sp.]|jgi:hypothetical protein
MADGSMALVYSSVNLTSSEILLMAFQLSFACGNKT